MILNISTYRFVSLDNLSHLQESILEACRSRNLKGTVLLAKEGFNMFLAGDEVDIHSFFSWLKLYPEFSDIQTKDSWSEYQPFKKMLVKIKDEIIKMNHPTANPTLNRAPSISATQLHHWLHQGHDDQGKPLFLLDTRNTFEVEFGTFKGAKHFQIDKFSDFPQALINHKDQLHNHRVISFCTGGIRCEKANLLPQEIGISESVQLDGGILKYFEEVGKDFYEGDCFVFDDRIALDPALQVSALNDEQNLP